MQRYHDVEFDPLPLYSPVHEKARALIAAQTQAFLDNGGAIEQVGFQMINTPVCFVINAQRSPVYAHLFKTPHTLH